MENAEASKEPFAYAYLPLTSHHEENKTLKSFFTYLAVLVIAGSLFSCENSQEEINALNRKALMTDRAVKVLGYLSQGGKVKAKLTAPVMLRVQADTVYTEFPNSLHVDFYNDSAKVESKLDSKYGKYMESISKIYLRDSVRVISIKGDTLYCQDLWWDQSKQLFYTDKPAKYNSAAQHLQGDLGLEATQDLKNVKFKNGHGQVQPGPGGVSGPADSSAQKGVAAPQDTSGHKGAAAPTSAPIQSGTVTTSAHGPVK